MVQMKFRPEGRSANKETAMPADDKRSKDDTLAESARAEDIADAELVSDALADRPTETAPPPPVRRRGGGAFLGTVLGGILAAGAGFGLARMVPGGWPVQGNSALEAQIKAQEDSLAGLKAQLSDLAARPVQDSTEEIAALKSELQKMIADSADSAAVVDPAPMIAEATGDIQASIAALDGRLTEIEKRPVGVAGAGVSSAAIAAYDRQLRDLRAQIAAQEGQGSDIAAQIEAVAADAKAQLAAAAQDTERLKAEAESAVQTATTGAAMGRIRAAIEAGGPYAGAVADLMALGMQIPPDIAGLAKTGVPTLTDLQRSFPAVARDALSAALRAQTPTGWGDRLTAFLRTQTGARSLSPRDGTDPDAVLSRAEGLLADGDIAATLAELGTLPAAAKDVLAPWVTEAESRQKAIAALSALSAAAAE
jgi:hypothetical protein